MSVKLKAPKGKLRVVGVDTFDGTDWVEDDFTTLNRAKKHADEAIEEQQMLKMHVYDDAGNHVYEAGSF